jgi:tRNA pseudouridine13 synthase
MTDPLPMPFGLPALRARMRVQPEDFFVEEVDAFAPDGAGEHLLLTIEKRGMNTAFVAQCIAAWAGVPESAIGYAGMKDRHAVTRQRFSVHLPGRASPEPATLESDGLRVLAADRHARKLQRGALRGNRFVLTLRDVVGERVAIEQRLAAIADQGFPNSFGEQRFGRGGGNLDAVLQLFAGRKMRSNQRGILLSAARSELFNVVLAARVDNASWVDGLPGEMWMLDGSHSVFGPESDPAQLADRVAARDIHPTGPMWGVGALRTAEACRALEESVLAPYVVLREGLEQAGLKQERRALRVIAADLQWEWTHQDVLRLGFTLPAGSYATSMLRALGEVGDAAAAAIAATVTTPS